MTFAMRQKKEQSKGKQPTFTQTWIITKSQIEVFGQPQRADRQQNPWGGALNNNDRNKFPGQGL